MSEQAQRSRASIMVKWMGVIMLAVSMTAIATIHYPREANLLSTIPWWLLAKGFAAIRVLPLVGFGVLIAILNTHSRVITCALFLFGYIAGFYLKAEFFSVLDGLLEVRGASHLTEFSLTEATPTVAIGIALLAPIKLRPWLSCLAVLILGFSLAIAIEYLAPSQTLKWIGFAGGLSALWLITSIALTLITYQRSWFAIGARILGSWLLTIGLLYGGSALVPKPKPPTPQTSQPQNSSETPYGTPTPDFDSLFPETIPEQVPANSGVFMPDQPAL